MMSREVWIVMYAFIELSEKDMYAGYITQLCLFFCGLLSVKLAGVVSNEYAWALTTVRSIAGSGLLEFLFLVQALSPLMKHRL